MAGDKVIQIDQDDHEIGEVLRTVAHRDGLLHRIAVVYVFDEQGNILVQERLDNGLFDHSAAGHVDPGETYLEAATREMEEEIGISGATLEEVGNVFCEEKEPEKNIDKKHLFKVYRCVGTPGKLQEIEVKSVHFEDPYEVYKKIQADSEHKIYTAGFEKTLELLLTQI